MDGETALAAPASDMSAGKGRVGIIDVGSNSIRLVVYERASRAPATRTSRLAQVASTCGVTLAKLLNEPNVTYPRSRAGKGRTSGASADGW